MLKPKQENNNAKRFNSGKPRLSLLPETACVQEALVWMHGEEKYGRDNWKKLWGDDTINTVLDSLLRHAFALSSGELFDKESGLPHAAHIRCNAGMILEHMKQQDLLVNTVKPAETEKTEEKMLTVLFTNQREFYDGILEWEDMIILPESEYDKFKSEHKNVRIKQEIPPFFIGGKL